MNRTCWAIAAALSIAGACGLAAYQAGANGAAMASRPTAVAVVDIQEVINGLDELRDREQELETFGKSLTARLDKLRQDNEQAETDLGLLPAGSPEFRERQEEFRRKTLELQFELDYSKARLDEKRAQIYSALFRKINEASARLAQQSGYDIVISSDSSATVPENGAEQAIRAMIVSRRLLYASDSVDVTDDLIRFMNNERSMGAARP